MAQLYKVGNTTFSIGGSFKAVKGLDSLIVDITAGINGALGMCSNPIGRKLYVSTSSGIYTLDLDTLAQLDYIESTAGGLSGLCYDRLHNYVYGVTSSGVIIVLDCSTNSIITTVASQTGGNKHYIAYNENTNTLYINNYDLGGFESYDGSTYILIKATYGYPAIVSITVDINRNYLLLASYDTGNFFVYDLVSETLLNTYSLSTGVRQSFIDYENNRVIITGGAPVIIRLDNFSLIKPLTGFSTFGVTASGGTIYLISNTPGDIYRLTRG